MSNIAIFSGTYCQEELVVQEVLIQTGFEPLLDADIVAEASRASGIPETKIDRAFTAKASVFNKFTHERERSIAQLKLALARRLTQSRLLIRGFVGHLVPRTVSHVLRVCLIADARSRAALAAGEQGVSESDALKLIHKQDEDRAAWVHTLWSQRDPWDPSLYDMVLPTDKMTPEAIAKAIRNSAESEVVRPSEASLRAVENFRLAAAVEVALAREGHNVGVTAVDGKVLLTINKHVLMLSRLESELKSIAGRVEGVGHVDTEVGPEFYQTDIYRKFDFETPSRILLVDDEREFVQTLSERLLMRDLGSAVAYDGESALEVVHEDEPEVMILDLKMPGIDGIEVLRRVKTSQPEIEVIILTGHGTEVDRQTCMELGAFAYLQKPVDIEELSGTIKRANEKIRRRKAGMA